MKLIIAGSRDLKVSTAFIQDAIERFGIKTSEIVSGGAAGIDTCAEQYAKDGKMMFARFPADWKTYGKAAGPVRNLAMALYSDALLIIWDGQSKGSANMKGTMNGLKKPVYEVILKRAT